MKTNLYETFSGRPVDRQFRVRVPDDFFDGRFVFLGEVKLIEYEAAIEQDTGEKEVYRHKFKKGAVLLATPSGERVLVITGKKIGITDRGIVG